MEQAMDAKKPDRRTIKTRKALCAGLAELHAHSNGCIAILEKWIRGGYIQQKDLIVKGISELDKHFEACCEENFA